MSEERLSLESLIPKSLDDIIRKNRNLFALGLASAEEIKALQSEIQPGLPVKDVIDDWRLICLRDLKKGTGIVFLLGDSQKEAVNWMTSTAIRIDLSQNVLATKSGSIYALGTPGVGEPHRDHLIHVCATFHYWGMGVYFDMPPFFY